MPWTAGLFAPLRKLPSKKQMGKIQQRRKPRKKR